MVIGTEVAGLPVAQVASEVRTHVTTSLFTGTYENAGLLVPEAKPLTFHSYAGVVPPFTGSAVKLTVVPSHTGFPLAVTDTLTGSNGFTTIFTGLEVAGFPLTHVSLEDSTQVTISPFDGAYV
jgi:hypothetical protein